MTNKRTDERKLVKCQLCPITAEIIDAYFASDFILKRPSINDFMDEAVFNFGLTFFYVEHNGGLRLKNDKDVAGAPATLSQLKKIIDAYGKLNWKGKGDDNPYRSFRASKICVEIIEVAKAEALCPFDMQGDIVNAAVILWGLKNMVTFNADKPGSHYKTAGLNILRPMRLKCPWTVSTFPDTLSITEANAAQNIPVAGTLLASVVPPSPTSAWLTPKDVDKALSDGDIAIALKEIAEDILPSTTEAPGGEQSSASSKSSLPDDTMAKLLDLASLLDN